jgi:hypothetical protein
MTDIATVPAGAGGLAEEWGLASRKMEKLSAIRLSREVANAASGELGNT